MKQTEIHTFNENSTFKLLNENILAYIFFLYSKILSWKFIEIKGPFNRFNRHIREIIRHRKQCENITEHVEKKFTNNKY